MDDLWWLTVKISSQLGQDETLHLLTLTGTVHVHAQTHTFTSAQLRGSFLVRTSEKHLTKRLSGEEGSWSATLTQNPESSKQSFNTQALILEDRKVLVRSRPSIMTTDSADGGEALPAE